MLCREEIEDKGGKVGVHTFRSWGTAVAFCLIVLLMSSSRDWEKSGHMPRYDRIYFPKVDHGLCEWEVSEASMSGTLTIPFN